MSIQDLKLSRTREDGKTYTTTVGNRYDDARKQREKVSKKQQRKAKWSAWKKKWFPIIWDIVKLLGTIAVFCVLLYFLFWVAIIGIALAAIGGGLSEGGREQQAQGHYYNEQRRNRPTNNPKYWRR